jgi:hypothetical protein
MPDFFLPVVPVDKSYLPWPHPQSIKLYWAFFYLAFFFRWQVGSLYYPSRALLLFSLPHTTLAPISNSMPTAEFAGTTCYRANPTALSVSGPLSSFFSEMWEKITCDTHFIRRRYPHVL